MHPTPEPKGHPDVTGDLCFGEVKTSADGITSCCRLCGAFFNPGEAEPYGHNLDAAQEDAPEA